MQSKETMLSLKHQSRSVSKRYQHCRCWNDSNNLTNFFQITIRVERYIFIIRHEEKEWTSLKIRLQNRDRIIKIRFVKRRERIVYYFYRVSNSREPFKANQCSLARRETSSSTTMMILCTFVTARRYANLRRARVRAWLARTRAYLSAQRQRCLWETYRGCTPYILNGLSAVRRWKSLYPCKSSCADIPEETLAIFIATRHPKFAFVHFFFFFFPSLFQMCSRVY